MSKNLVIVESPAKAKTIEKYLGKEFTVLSSVGHIRSIPKKAVRGHEPIDIKNGFKTIYEIDSEKKKVISDLKKAVATAETVWLATDEDREGEAIAWHLCEVLGLDVKTTKRIVFHEITKTAIEEAIKKPRTIDMQLVEAQQARQILDRLVGFELSPVVWQKVPGGKSAGRVQSPAVRLLVEREREINAFESAAQFKVTAEFLHDGTSIKAELNQRFDTEEAAHDFLASLNGAKFSVAKVAKTPGTRNPGAPFTTSTLQQEANSRLGFGSRATMASAQKLYQAGFITYMRTDSVTLSKQALAASAEYIKATYGDQYSQVRNFKTKSASAQEAHEAIRPTDMAATKVKGDQYDQKLYDLIRNRTLASQMAPAKIEKTTITIDIVASNTSSETASRRASNGAPAPVETRAADVSSLVFEATGEVVLFDGFLKVYGNRKDDSILPALSVNDELNLQSAEARQVFGRPPARYTEGSLVKKMEELGIGRPSTYATIINTIMTRGYAEKGEGEGVERDVIVLATAGADVTREVVQEKTGSTKGKLIPTAIGQMISDFLTIHFEQVIDYGFTADVEDDFDKIATGSLARNIMLERFYTPFHKLVEKSGDIERSSVAQAREIGIDPKTKLKVYSRLGRFGPMVQLGSADDEEKPRFAPLPKGRSLENVTLEEALHAFELPRVVGTTDDGQEIKANIGRFGPYIQVGKLYVSIKPLDPHEVTEEQARQFYADKLKAEAEKNIADLGEGVRVLNGRFGPYVTDGTKNAKIPKDTDPKSITLEQAKTMLAEAPAKGRGRRFTRRKASK